jgi:hypothetical protein
MHRFKNTEETSPGILRHKPQGKKPGLETMAYNTAKENHFLLPQRAALLEPKGAALSMEEVMIQQTG